jgi:hypothetical protein
VLGGKYTQRNNVELIVAAATTILCGTRPLSRGIRVPHDTCQKIKNNNRKGES